MAHMMEARQRKAWRGQSTRGASRSGVPPAGIREVWTRASASTRADAVLEKRQGAVNEALRAAEATAARAGAAGGKLGIQLRRAIVATHTKPRVVRDEHYEALVQVLGGEMETADWGSKRTKELKGVMERHVQSAQTAAAQMLQGWSERVKVARKWTNWRERNRGRMGAVMWA